jgi:hypothetical protein
MEMDMETKMGTTGKPVFEAEMACFYRGRLCGVWFHVNKGKDACITYNGYVKFIRVRDIEYVLFM